MRIYRSCSTPKRNKETLPLDSLEHRLHGPKSNTLLAMKPDVFHCDSCKDTNVAIIPKATGAELLKLSIRIQLSDSPSSSPSTMKISLVDNAPGPGARYQPNITDLTLFWTQKHKVIDTPVPPSKNFSLQDFFVPSVNGTLSAAFESQSYEKVGNYSVFAVLAIVLIAFAWYLKAKDFFYTLSPVEKIEPTTSAVPVTAESLLENEEEEKMPKKRIAKRLYAEYEPSVASNGSDLTCDLWDIYSESPSHHIESLLNNNPLISDQIEQNKSISYSAHSQEDHFSNYYTPSHAITKEYDSFRHEEQDNTGDTGETLMGDFSSIYTEKLEDVLTYFDDRQNVDSPVALDMSDLYQDSDLLGESSPDLITSCFVEDNPLFEETQPSKSTNAKYPTFLADVEDPYAALKEFEAMHVSDSDDDDYSASDSKKGLFNKPLKYANSIYELTEVDPSVAEVDTNVNLHEVIDAIDVIARDVYRCLLSNVVINEDGEGPELEVGVVDDLPPANADVKRRLLAIIRTIDNNSMIQQAIDPMMKTYLQNMLYRLEESIRDDDEEEVSGRIPGNAKMESDDSEDDDDSDALSEVEDYMTAASIAGIDRIFQESDATIPYITELTNNSLNSNDAQFIVENVDHYIQELLKNDTSSDYLDFSRCSLEEGEVSASILSVSSVSDTRTSDRFCNRTLPSDISCMSSPFSKLKNSTFLTQTDREVSEADVPNSSLSQILKTLVIDTSCGKSHTDNLQHPSLSEKVHAAAIAGAKSPTMRSLIVNAKSPRNAELIVDCFRLTQAILHLEQENVPVVSSLDKDASKRVMKLKDDCLQLSAVINQLQSDEGQHPSISVERSPYLSPSMAAQAIKESTDGTTEKRLKDLRDELADLQQIKSSLQNSLQEKKGDSSSGHIRETIQLHHEMVEPINADRFPHSPKNPKSTGGSPKKVLVDKNKSIGKQIRLTVDVSNDTAGVVSSGRISLDSVAAVESINERSDSSKGRYPCKEATKTLSKLPEGNQIKVAQTVVQPTRTSFVKSHHDIKIPVQTGGIVRSPLNLDQPKSKFFRRIGPYESTAAISKQADGSPRLRIYSSPSSPIGSPVSLSEILHRRKDFDHGLYRQLLERDNRKSDLRPTKSFSIASNNDFSGIKLNRKHSTVHEDHAVYKSEKNLAFVPTKSISKSLLRK